MAFQILKFEPTLNNNKNFSAPSLGLWVLAVLAFLMFFLRFSRLSSFSTWPSTDDGWFGAYALDLYEKWNWNLLFGYIKFPAINFWPQVLLFKAFGPSLFSLFLLPALLSVLIVFFAYFAAREYFSKSFSILCSSIAAFSFWPLLVGRIPGGGGAIPVLELVVLVLVGRMLKSETGNKRLGLALLLGVGLALGFYCSFYYWASYWAWMNLFFLWLGFREQKTRSSLLKVFLVEVALLIPLALVFWQDGAWQYVKSLLFVGHNNAWVAGGFNSLSYLTSFLWGADPSGFVYRPLWGGFLNPVSGAFFIFGFIGLIGRWKDTLWRWVLFSFPFLLLPGLLSQTFEMYRIISMLPLVILITAIGISDLFHQFPKKSKVFLALFLISLSLDTYHLFVVYRQIWAVPGIQWRPFKSLERWRAFEILESQQQEKGPGLILTDFVTRNFDRTLDLATYSFNVDRNQSLSKAQSTWVAVMFPSHLKPFLSKRFAEGKWYDLSEGLPDSYENKCLGIIPYSEKDKQTFAQWELANHVFKEVNRKMLYSSRQMTFQEYETALLSERSAVGKDPFLESCFDQKLLGAFDTGAEPQKAVYVAQRGLKYGYPSAFFTDELANLNKAKR